MAAALMLSLTSGDHIARKTKDGVAMSREAAAIIRPNDRLSSLERLEIYSRSYWYRLLASLRDDFPGLALLLGSENFERLARAYLTDCPSRSFTLRDLGSRLEAWLREHPALGGANPELALDMVRLEWAHIVAFDGPAARMLGPEDLLKLTPALRMGVQPCISLMEVHYPVDKSRIQANAEPEGLTIRSNVAFKKERGSRQRKAPVNPERIYLAVHRFDCSVYYRRVSHEEFRLLGALRAGRPVGIAINLAFRNSEIDTSVIPELLKTWFATWTELGWLSVFKARKGSRS